MNLIVLQAAKDELDEAIGYYEQIRPELGEAFAEEVEHALQKIVRFPGAWSRLSDTVRRCRLDRFPYGVVYTTRGDDVFVLAIMHLHRKPGYWADRLE